MMFAHMDAPPTPDPADLLPKAIYRHLCHALRTYLPPPPTDTPEEATRREQAALEHAISLCPVTFDEAGIAAQYVGASLQAMDCLRLARRHPDDAARVLKCTAQSASMMRQARAWRLALDRAQAERCRRDATADAVADFVPIGPPVPALAPETPAQAPPPDSIAEAERYALHHRKRAVLVRRLGHLPGKFGWLPPAVQHAIATGNTPILRGLDEKPHRAMAEAA